MSAQDPIGSTVPPEHPVNPTHFGGDGLYEPAADKPDIPGTGADASSNPDTGAADPSSNTPRSAQSSFWEFAKRNHVPAVLAVGGIVWLLASVVRRATER
jgi:hypothetical protein